MKETLSSMHFIQSSINLLASQLKEDLFEFSLFFTLALKKHDDNFVFWLLLCSGQMLSEINCYNSESWLGPVSLCCMIFKLIQK